MTFSLSSDNQNRRPTAHQRYSSTPRYKQHSGVQRKGFTVFVNHVSKRIHRLTLQEAFSVYGEVADVYIAYNNVKRKNRRDTFAFIRFAKQGEAMKAIEQGDGRRMDGFNIKCYMGRSVWSRQPLSANQNATKRDIPATAARKYYKLTDGRSYKEALTTRVDNGPEKLKDGGD
ncbi:hypothetical protein HRI_001271500 [Hibiscus trionum]|uniref:RRM domain-containing protein n=1 Tax=Hibiscus trionum TaxID=183268 RepID=A0A9W7LSQ9_HIBTR|nr:hypothetical protein HRI_001271500 [Hibiscus trionum]